MGETELWCASGADGIKSTEDGFVSADAADVMEVAPLLPPGRTKFNFHEYYIMKVLTTAPLDVIPLAERRRW